MHTHVIIYKNECDPLNGAFSKSPKYQAEWNRWCRFYSDDLKTSHTLYKTQTSQIKTCVYLIIKWQVVFS